MFAIPALLPHIKIRNAAEGGIDDWPFHHDCAMGKCPPEAKHNEIRRLWRRLNFRHKFFDFVQVKFLTSMQMPLDRVLRRPVFSRQGAALLIHSQWKHGAIRTSVLHTRMMMIRSA
jgi:hypothetical protein